MAKKLIFININFKKVAINMNFGNDEPLYSISTAARLLNISVHTLRMYEREGLIIPYRKESHHRLYTKSDIDRLTCIRHAINTEKLSIAGIKMMYSLIPCWDIKKCSESDRADCEAYNNTKKACWMFKHEKNPCGDIPCRECTVYKDFTDCGRIKESIRTLSERK